MIEIASDSLRAAISPLGAELQSLADRAGREFMSSGDPAFWSGRAPLLFPIVGRLEGDTLRSDGTCHRLEKHGFARRSMFEVVAQGLDHARFRLTDSRSTRALYPFAFSLFAAFRLTSDTLQMEVVVHNPGPDPLPFSFGYHPAFAWPLPGNAERSAHEIAFEQDEPASLRRVTPYGTLAAEPKTSPVGGNRFVLDDTLFADDALVWTELASRALTYGAPGGSTLTITFPDTPYIGIWTKPGAAFVCIEPWAGHADPEGYADDFSAKPGVMTIGPGSERAFRMDVTVRT